MWTMSPGGIDNTNGFASEWYVGGSVGVYSSRVDNPYVANLSLRPVINLNTSVLASGTGISDDPYEVQTN